MKLMLFAPELWLLAGSLLLFVITLGSSRAVLARLVTQVVGVGAVIFCLLTMGQQGQLFFGVYQVDFFSQFFKLIIAIGFSVVLLLGTELKGIPHRVRPEYYLFLLLSTIGLVMLVSSVELLTIFIALELSSYSLYLLVPMRDEKTGVRFQMESAIKYVLFGVVATGVMLFGMSYLFGLTGTTHLAELLPKLRLVITQPAAIVGLAMVMGGFFFKLGVFPFHFWMPDVYQGASNETTTFIATVPKLGAVALLIRIASLAMEQGQTLVTLLIILAVLSMFYGNLVALVQKDIKRLLGFSGIAHAGYVLIGVLTFNEVGYSTSIYYIVGYLIMNLACFLVICNVSRQGENLAIEDLSGLHKRAPLMALTLAVGMFALAGIPPFVGFMGKFMLLAGALREGYLVLVILAALNTAISIYYYLSVVRITYCNTAEEGPSIETSILTKAMSITLMVVIIVMGLAPSRVLEMTTAAVRTLW